MTYISSKEEELQTIMSYISLFVYVCAIAMTGYAALNMSSLHLAAVPDSVRPIFGASSPVTDLSRGDLSAALRLVRRHEATLLFFYAPWDEESLRGRKVLEEISPVLYGLKVGIVAVNCWLPRGECRRRFSHVPKYPIVRFCFRSGKGLEYRGRLDTESLLSFITACLRPLVRVHSIQQLERLRAQYSSVFVGYAPFSATARAPPLYYHLLNSAICWQFVELNSDAVWAIITDRFMGESLSPFLVPGSFTVFNWNCTYVLEPQGDTSLSRLSITEFAQRMWRPLPAWLELDDVKSTVLDRLTASGPVLFVLSARSDVRATHHLAMLRRIWIKYSTCSNAMSSPLSDTLFNTANKQAFFTRDSECFCEREGWTLRDKIIDCFRGYECRFSAGYQRDCVTVYSKPNPQWFEGREHCVLCRSVRARPAECVDKPSAAHSCYKPADLKPDHAWLPDERALQLIKGRGCYGNRTLTMIMLDRERYPQIVRRLLGSMKNASIAVIVDRQLEEVYSLNDPLSLASLVRFIDDWSRLRRSRDLTYNSDLVASSDPGQTVDEAVNVDNKMAPYHAGIVRLNSDTFVKYVNNVTQDVLLVLESAGCGHCAVLNHVLVTLDHLISASEIVIARIDANNNALPWPFTVSRLPTLMFLPSNSDGDSLLFPPDRAITVESVLRFILSHTTSSNAASILTN